MFRQEDTISKCPYNRGNLEKGRQLRGRAGHKVQGQ